MDYMNRNISENLKRIRLARGYSLDLVAEQTGVSKSMLGQIERNEANPTVSTLEKIMSGLRISLEDLVQSSETPFFHVNKADLIPSKEKEGEYRVYTYFPYVNKRGFEIYVIEILPGAAYHSGGHGENTREYILVENGILTLQAEGMQHTIQAGDAFRFNTELKHVYENNTTELLRFTTVFSFIN